MLKHKDIPNRVIETAKTVYTAEIYKGQATAKEYHDAMLAAITAALNEWPKAEWRESGIDHKIISRRLILPLPDKEGN